jgi:2-polyprenyl-3-methyl-5-hydroxy-6-metoxy-1,4-benzoquinol methylase
VRSFEGINTENVETCILCGSKGSLLYASLRDRLFGVEGAWSEYYCLNDGHVWLNPRPDIEDISKVYKKYYTHSPKNGQHSSLFSFLNILEGILLFSEYGYSTLSSRKTHFLKYLLTRCIPMYKEIVGSKIMWLKAYPNGNLLDVGCGNGSFLSNMKKLGWNVIGIEPDATAAEFAMDHFSIPVIIGDIEKANLPGGSFDAITAHHVIEHLHDPIGFLKKCALLLKPNGMLVITTPNSESWGHRVFKMAWRELDAPRHLHLFSPKTIKDLAEQAGFKIHSNRTTARSTWEIWCSSYLIKRHGSVPEDFPENLNSMTRVAGLIIQLIQHTMLCFKKGIGEGIVLIASKQ